MRISWWKQLIFLAVTVVVAIVIYNVLAIIRSHF